MGQLCDLHTHSHFSDGTWSPEQLIRGAEEAGLSAIALCDHNTVDGLPEFVAAGAKSPVEAVPGIEFSTDYGDTELHILALFVQPEHYGAINTLLEQAKQRKEQSNIDLVARLAAAGMDIDYDAIKEAQNGFVNRAVIGAELTRKGYTDSVQDAFQRYLSPKRGFYKPPKRLDVFETIAFIRSIGAVAVLAHPFLNLDEAGLRGFLPAATEQGLCAMEVLYSKYDAATTELAQRIAAEYGLLPSGGSDFHGENKPDIAIGTGRGTLRIPGKWLDDLRQKKGK